MTSPEQDKIIEALASEHGAVKVLPLWGTDAVLACGWRESCMASEPDGKWWYVPAERTHTSRTRSGNFCRPRGSDDAPREGLVRDRPGLLVDPCGPRTPGHVVYEGAEVMTDYIGPFGPASFEAHARVLRGGLGDDGSDCDEAVRDDARQALPAAVSALDREALIGRGARALEAANLPLGALESERSAVVIADLFSTEGEAG